MLLDLREIIELPGGKVTFDYNPDLSALVGGSVREIEGQSRAVGSVENNAGLLTFTCAVDATASCDCARCLCRFKLPIQRTVTANITESGVGEDPDGYFIQDDKIDVSEIISTELLLNLSDKLLCRDDCAGLCQQCGADLNTAPCNCKKEIDPRLAVLEQLLDDTKTDKEA